MNTVGTYSGINYLLHEPSYGTNQPLIIFLHGIGERGSLADIRNLEKYGPCKITKNGDLAEIKGNYFVLAPQLSTSYGSWPSGHVAKMIEFASKELPNVDTSRIYLMGISLGGGGVYSALQDPLVAPKIAAAVVCCGTNTLKSVDLIVRYQIPVYIFHSTDDSVVPVSISNNAYDAIRNAGGIARFQRMTGYGHNVWDTVLSNEQKAYKLSNGTMNVNDPRPYKWVLTYQKSA